MNKYSFGNLKPSIGDKVLLAKGAIVIGDCHLGDKVNIWFNCVLRGDVNSITIGENTNIQDLSMLHVTEINKLVVGKNVSVGHSVILHGCMIGDGSLIGMGAKILDGASIGKNSIVAAGSVVPPNKVYPDGSYIIGNPAKVKRALTQDEIDHYSNHYKSYLKYAKQFRDKSHFKEID